MIFLRSDEDIEERFLGQPVVESVTAYCNSHGRCEHSWWCPSIVQPDTAEIEKIWFNFCLA